jgi:polyhydroxyalkanoate synthase
MAGSGHIAGVVNPPAKKKYQFWTGPLAPTLKEWMAKASETPGSWWPDWASWLGALSWPKVPAPDPASGPLPPLEDAPGSYVRERL